VNISNTVNSATRASETPAEGAVSKAMQLSENSTLAAASTESTMSTTTYTTTTTITSTTTTTTTSTTTTTTTSTTTTTPPSVKKFRFPIYRFSNKHVFV
jgi:hypothetical protein